jgi:hypothetical protein
MGPPRRSLCDVADAIEPHLDILSVRSAGFRDLPEAAKAWICLSRLRTAPAQPLTRHTDVRVGESKIRANGRISRSARAAGWGQSQPTERQGDQPKHQGRGTTDYSIAGPGTTVGDRQNQPAVDHSD